MNIKNRIFSFMQISAKNRMHLKRFKTFSFEGNECQSEKQYEAVITRWLHTIEKGLSYLDYRAGFGRENINQLLKSMENYVSEGYSKDAFFFKTALSTLGSYVEKNKEHNVYNPELEKRIQALGGEQNHFGGTISFTPASAEEVRMLGYEEFVKSRHSMRHFSKEPLELERIENAIQLAQHTPSACNRQGWRTIIISDEETQKLVRANQNGNKGFGEEFDKMLLITADLRCANRDRELYQAFIDGGMYAQGVLSALHYEHIAAVSLSASLTQKQEANIRKKLNLHEAEILILLIGIGNYPEVCQTARAERKSAEIEVI